MHRQPARWMLQQTPLRKGEKLKGYFTFTRSFIFVSTWAHVSTTYSFQIACFIHLDINNYSVPLSLLKPVRPSLGSQVKG